jgi:hypothetical protein
METSEELSKRYTSALAEAMANTRERLLGDLLGSMMPSVRNYETEVNFDE